MIHLTTLGSVRIGTTDGPLSSATGQQAKRLALLSYLAIARPRGAHRRDTILGLLWPELDHERSRSALRQALHGLRKTLGAEAVISRGTELIELDPGVVSCDLHSLEVASGAGDASVVLDLYRGEMLAGLFIADAPAFEHWVDSERARVNALVLEASWQVAEGGGSKATVANVLRGVRAAMALSRSDEAALRRGMRLLSNAGATIEALALHDRFIAEMRREYDVEPSAETTMLADELRRSRREVPIVAKLLTNPPRAAIATVIMPEQPPPATARPNHRRYRIAAAVGVAIVLVGVAAELAPSAESELDPRQVSVMQFTADGPALDSIAHRLTVETRATLSSLDGMMVLADNRSSVARAGTIVRGRLTRDDDAVELRAELVDARTGKIKRTVISHAASQEMVSAIAAKFNDRIAAALSASLYPGWGSSLSQPPSYRGYQLFVDGMRRIRAEDHDGAVAAFRQAFSEDSTFTIAAIVGGIQLYHAGRFVAADSIVRSILPRRAQLPPADERLLEWLARSLRGDRIGARAAMQSVVALAPGSDLASLQLAIDNVETARPSEALAALDNISSDAEFGEGWLGYWTTRAEALHLMGEHERELVTVRSARMSHPELGALAGYELRALAALGRVDEVMRTAESSAYRTADPIVTLRVVAMELAAHGYRSESITLLQRLRAEQVSLPTSSRVSISAIASKARTLYLLDARDPAKSLYDSLLREIPDCSTCIGALGVLAARSGDRTAAEGYERRLAGSSKPFQFGRRLQLRARIAASLGDTARATTLLTAAYADGLEFDILTHADRDLSAIRPDSLYRVFAGAHKSR